MIKKTQYLLWSLLIIMMACEKKPSSDECKIALANFVRIKVAGVSEGISNTQINKMIEEDPVSKKFIQMCVKTKSRKKVECEMKALDMSQLDACKSL